MNDQDAASIRRLMNGALLDRDVAVNAVEIAEQLVVISRDINDPRPLARFAQDLLDHVVMLLRPVTAPAHLPDIDQIAHHVERLHFVLAQKIEQQRRITSARPEMHIGNPRRPHFSRRKRRRNQRRLREGKPGSIKCWHPPLQK